MARLKSETLTTRESQIMAVLWEDGPVTAEQVRETLPLALHDTPRRVQVMELPREKTP